MRASRASSGDAWWTALVAALLLLVVTALAATDFDKRSDTEYSLSPMPFVMGSRYGRSSGMKFVSPRNDRFFMSSRYGKRSEGAEGVAASLLEGAVREGGGTAEARGLVCEFTGVAPLYRCVGHHNRDHYDARIGDESGAEV